MSGLCPHGKREFDFFDPETYQSCSHCERIEARQVRALAREERHYRAKGLRENERALIEFMRGLTDTAHRSKRRHIVKRAYPGAA